MSAEDIKAGDVVVLKSGGPKMTAASVHPNGVVGCYWFAEAQIREADFVGATLRVVPTDSPGQGSLASRLA